MDADGDTQGGRTIFRRRLSPVDFERMNLPEEFWRTKIFNVAESVRSKVEGFLVNVDSNLEGGIGLIVSGPEGTGKTGIASLVLKEARSRGFPVFFITVWDLRVAIRNRTPFDDDTSVLDRCLEVDVLVLDSLREEDVKDTFFDARALEELVRSRISRRKMTVVTTRLGLGDMHMTFKSFMGATKSSLAFLEVTGPDLRKNPSEGLTDKAFGLKTG